MILSFRYMYFDRTPDDCPIFFRELSSDQVSNLDKSIKYYTYSNGIYANERDLGTGDNTYVSAAGYIDPEVFLNRNTRKSRRTKDKKLAILLRQFLRDEKLKKILNE